ncbi:tRNA uridine-5-carboxymethylaminomethyl(34) synthesis GTPase MnmE [Chthonobacter rhizosphaerae]|uniref:tRNA uridine-5-carboxymethylaminomethyl(34) synthesis GTPase MnmE n=1 Tax=Chthonobacter rhizosphaerae TaxID=2735553 RepID=UPI0015EFCBC4|nr:tRNA uridine-5-carboxymethylaminomethyl(34) synthesis GTPase MnmE [Chthonobacter rhizosphaerae]
MAMEAHTLFALSTGRGPAGVAVVRVSGPQVQAALLAVFGRVPAPRTAAYGAFLAEDGSVIDHGLALFFPGPRSFTGEDVAEFHGHGGRAVVAALLARLGGLPGLAPAEAGAFTRRAFENGKLDLTAVEGLADLVHAETELQRRQALRLADGAFGRLALAWRADLLTARSLIEADLDFSDEEDVPGSVLDQGFSLARSVRAAMERVLDDRGRGERIRDGFQVVVLGPPNAGKSSLVNHLAGRDVAIVTETPGTTRDLLEVHLDLGGLPVTLVDTAGLRESEDRIEQEGVRRARHRAGQADLVVWMDPDGRPPPGDLEPGCPVIRVRSQADRVGRAIESDPNRLDVSVVTGAGVDVLLGAIADTLGEGFGEPALIAHERQRHCIAEAVAALKRADDDGAPLEVRADEIRVALTALGRLVGQVDVEEVLGAIFQAFCIGK